MRRLITYLSEVFDEMPQFNLVIIAICLLWLFMCGELR